ncbi:acyltransferase [Fulvivirgaceae bacterium BMA10]|uniref:Acyltransferase n=1 Tax=Splendidivirga corallicola TaxID=3051826 RepID=A0ABT8KGX7_9BACT|nr:acyltransferase [Fulvivirgaceae bacterium BMA10]
MVNEQLRKNLKYTLKHRFRFWRQKKRLESCGQGVYFDKNIEIMRFPKNVSLGNHIVVKEGARICSCNERAKISIGDNTTIGYHTFIFASEKIQIGNDCLIAPFVYIVDSNHGTEKGININTQPNTTAPVIIGKDVWIGTGAKILSGARIDDGAIIAAGAVVGSHVPANTIFGGIPAKKIGERT